MNLSVSYIILTITQIRFLVSGTSDGSNTLFTSIEVKEKDRKIYFINPCTGSVSNDAPTEEEIRRCKTPLQFEFSEQSDNEDESLIESTMPNEPPEPDYKGDDSLIESTLPIDSFEPVDNEGESNLNTKYQCPNTDCSYDENSKNSIKIHFFYSIETSSNIKDPNILLPGIEQDLLAKLAEDLLSHCNFENDIRKLLVTYGAHKRYTRRNLKRKRYLAPTGVCSEPGDEYKPTIKCFPNLEESNNCFVIKGIVSVALGEEDDESVIASSVLNITESTMENDEISTNVIEIKEINYLGNSTYEFIGNQSFEREEYGEIDPIDDEDHDDEKGSFIEISNGKPDRKDSDKFPAGVVLGTSFAALVSILALILLRNRREVEEEAEEEDQSPFGMVAFPGIVNFDSFIISDSRNLGKSGACTDVHRCKSQTCWKCYSEKAVQFIGAPQNKDGKFVQANADVVPSATFSNDSSESLQPKESCDSEENSWSPVAFSKLSCW